MRPFNMQRFGIAVGVGLVSGVAAFAVAPMVTSPTKAERWLATGMVALTAYSVSRFIQSRIPEE